MNKPAISIQNLTVKYDDDIILDNINLDINENEIVAIIGPNGSGKSTLLRAVLGLIGYEGKIKIWNQPAKTQLDKIGYVPQKINFDKTFPLTVKEFFQLTNKNDQEIKQALTEVGMLPYQDHLLGNLSGGQLQRVLIAHAISKHPRLLLLDEATAGIDKEGEKNFYEIISHLHKQHQTTIVMISHEINMVYKFADKIICLNRGLVCFGSPDQAITKKILHKLYGEDINFTAHNH